MAATNDSFELTSAEQNRLKRATTTVAERRNGDIPIRPVAERADLSVETVREALWRLSQESTRLRRQSEDCWEIADY